MNVRPRQNPAYRFAILLLCKYMILKLLLFD